MPLKPQPKTYFMSLIEAQHSGQAIETLIVNAFRAHGNERAAAQSLGISQQTFNTWKYRLGLEQAIEESMAIQTLSTSRSFTSISDIQRG